MKISKFTILSMTAVVVGLGGMTSPAYATFNVAQSPLYLEMAVPPLNMLVMGRDHKLYYEAYNDSSDLNGDGVLDVGYKPGVVEYYGYFNSAACYSYDGSAGSPGSSDKWVPSGVANATTRACSSGWSGDFLNYLTTARIDALRKVLYGGFRSVDSDSRTILQRSFITQDGHSFGKEYTSVAVDGYDIRDYSDLNLPGAGRRHLFANVSTTDNGLPLLRILRSSPFRVWNWASIERPVANSDCNRDDNVRVSCTVSGGTKWERIPASAFVGAISASYFDRGTGGSPADVAGMNNIDATYGVPARLCGTEVLTTVYRNINPFAGVGLCRADGDKFFSKIVGRLAVPSNVDRIAIRGDDAIDFFLDGSRKIDWYGGHASGGTSDADLENHDFSVSEGTYDFIYRHEENTGGQEYDLWWRVDSPAASGPYDYAVRVEVCPGGESGEPYREANCKQYPDGNWKPTGILHDYGEDNRMYFGLLTGSYINNLEGGILRRNIGSFADEVLTATTGQWNTGVQGIRANLDSFREIGFGYPPTNYYWSSDCPALGTRALQNRECRMWGNPLGEMMFETLRYFAGGGTASSAYSNVGGTGSTEESTLGLSRPAWKDPYTPVADGGLGYIQCAKPVITAISDINPSYDTNMPGSAWTSSSFSLPSSISSFNASTSGSAIWSHEYGGSKSVFIGEAGGVVDSAPTSKSASSFSDIRGLAPEEPTKEGSYYSAAVAYYGWTNPQINANSTENIRTYSVALASPLPKIEIPMGLSNKITLVPFAKTVGGAFSVSPSASFQPTNTIVDFYVEKIVNLPGQPTDITKNGGRGYAVFRINYEDVEQGNDHDMDAIVRYEIKVNEDGTVTVNLTSEYAAGSADQYMGYVISGTTEDGIYLEVRDHGSGDHVYRFNTPAGESAGFCNVSTPPASCNGLPLTASRTFSAGSSGSATVLPDPLWFAAKYGGFNDHNLNGVPDDGEWDVDLDGNPDNYFLVTNAGRLRAELDKAFDQIILDASPTGGVAASGTRRDAGFMVYIPEYKPVDWTGTLKAFRTTASGAIGALVWNASDKLASVSPSARNIFATVEDSGDFELVPFEVDELGGDTAAETLLDIGISDYAAYGGAVDVEDVINWLRGDASLATAASDPLRSRSSKLGDILNSQPGITTKASFGYTTLPASMGGGNSGSGSYGEFLSDVKATRDPVIFVGANDGMLHAFSATETGGDELFAVIPNSVLRHLKELPKQSYQHRYYVDSSPVIADARLGGTWKTVLLYSTGAGGTSVSALDVTNAAAGFDENDFLWEFQHADMGLAMVSPQVLLLADGTWAALFGNGVNSANHRGKVFLVDLEDGSVISEIYTGTDGDAADSNGVMSVAAADTDFDGFPDTAYAGDLHGKLWKLDVASDGAMTLANSGVPLFAAKDDDNVRQMITGGIEIALHHVRGQMVFFGTGKYFEVGDNAPVADPQVQTFYGIWDDPEASGAVSRNDLQAQTIDGQTTEDGYELRSVSDDPIDWETEKGWYLNLAVGSTNKGERFIGTPRVELGNAIFTTFTSLGDECDPGGENWLYVLNAITGARSLDLGSSGESGAVLAGTGAPAVAPPIVTTPPQTECRPGIDAGCDIMGEDEDGNACVYGEPGCDTLSPSAGAGCTSDVGLVLSTGIRRFATLSCGRQSWRQMQ